ncbi:hypothetical protein BKI52_21010 [marine bacterium AO1-C]|nr:hypothetical protein BKI52_21010 [marine bacterium AO1-C]
MKLTPIALFTYKRPQHTLQTLESLQNNELGKLSSLYIFSDAAKSSQDQVQVNQVKQIIRQKQWCNEVHIIERESNYGLAKNIIEGITQMVNQFGKVIVLEDDIVTSSGFLTYMNQALDLYQNTPEVMHISAYLPPIDTHEVQQDTFFFNQTSCWGWGTWKSAWEKFIPDPVTLYQQVKIANHISRFNMDNSYDFMSHLKANLEGSLHTWAIKWYASVFLEKGLCLHPKISLTRNIGFDNTGEHCVYSKEYLEQKITDEILVTPISIAENKIIRQKIATYNRNQSKPPTFRELLKNKIRNYLKWKR